MKCTSNQIRVYDKNCGAWSDDKSEVWEFAIVTTLMVFMNICMRLLRCSFPLNITMKTHLKFSTHVLLHGNMLILQYSDVFMLWPIFSPQLWPCFAQPDLAFQYFLWRLSKCWYYINSKCNHIATEWNVLTKVDDFQWICKWYHPV